MAEWIDIAPATAVRPGAPATAEVNGVPVAVVRLETGALHALQNLCPHRGGPVGAGKVAGTLVTCAWHGWAFDVTTGAHASGGPAQLRLFEVEERDGRVRVRLP